MKILRKLYLHKESTNVVIEKILISDLNLLITVEQDTKIDEEGDFLLKEVVLHFLQKAALPYYFFPSDSRQKISGLDRFVER